MPVDNSVSFFLMPASGLPAPWQQQDVGAVGLAGDANFANGLFTVKGSGADIWDYSNSFHFVWQPLTGNGEIIARVLGVQNTDVWAKAGVMMRSSLAANSPYALMAVSASRGATYQWCDFVNGNGGSRKDSSAG